MFIFPDKVRIIEVSPRDGLQSESIILNLKQKIHLVNSLSKCGYKAIEIGSLVNSKLLPQMKQTEELYVDIVKNDSCQYFVLVGNMKYLKMAVDIGVKNISLMCSVSETFSQHNIRQNNEENINSILDMIKYCQKNSVFTRIYVSCCFNCPYDGVIETSIAASFINKIWSLGCDEISLSDTTGKATVLQVYDLLELCLKSIPVNKIAMHFHDINSQALPNVLASLQMGIENFDASVAGIGGCPFVAESEPIMNGNLATEQLLIMLHGMNIETGISNNNLNHTKNYLLNALNRINQVEKYEME